MAVLKAIIGWVIILWVVWLVWARTTILQAIGGFVRSVGRAFRQAVDRDRALDVGAVFAGMLAGPKAVGLAMGFVGGYIGATSLSFGLSISEMLWIATAMLATGLVVHWLRGE